MSPGTTPRPVWSGRHLMVGGLIASGVVVLAAGFPWHDMVWHSHWSRVAWIPFVSRPIPFETLDVAGNLLLCVPVGIMAGLAFGRAAIVAGAIALSLSLVVETAQLYSHSRFPSATDVVCNIAGAIVAAMVVRRLRVWLKSEGQS